MFKRATIAGLGALALSWGAASTGRTAEPSAQAQSCAERAQQQGLEGKGRETFMTTCKNGSLAPKRPTTPAPESRSAEALTAPSGADRTTRSKQCNTEAARRGLKEEAMQAFRKSCLASAAPVTAIQTAHRSETPTPDKPKLDTLPR